MNQDDTLERRSNQRVFAAQQGHPRFWISYEGLRLPVIDLSLRGFSFHISCPPRGDEIFEFTLIWEGAPGEITGRAQIVNYLGSAAGGQAGCRLERISDTDRQRLTEWLIRHVQNTSAVNITEKEVLDIVSGPSFI